MKRADLKAAGLGTALKEIGHPCSNQHAVFLDRGYRYCPFCAQELKIVKLCETCGHRFLSEAAYTNHLFKHRLTKCPKCNSRRGFVVHNKNMWDKAWTGVRLAERPAFHPYECMGCHLYFDSQGKVCTR